jgi:hypothetical protein
MFVLNLVGSIQRVRNADGWNAENGWEPSDSERSM